MKARLLIAAIIVVAVLGCLWLMPRTGDPSLDYPLQITLLLILLVYVPYSLWPTCCKPEKKKDESPPPSDDPPTGGI